MAAAYAALVSLVHFIKQIELYHSRQPIFVNEQLEQLKHIYKKMGFLQDFLDNYNGEIEGLEMSRIAYAAYAVEDIIDSHIVDGINQVRSENLENDNSNKLSQELQKIVEDIKLIEKEVIKIKEKSRLGKRKMRDIPHERGSSRPHPSEKNAMVGFDENLNELMDMLSRQQAKLQVISITGMGGIGKTILAQNVYTEPYIMQCFDVRGWVTISQEFNIRDIVSDLLVDIGVLKCRSDLEYDKLGESLHKHLCGRKYLIIIDDLWDAEVFEILQLFLPDYNNGSRIMITTRLLDVGKNVCSCDIYQMNLLDENKSWDLLRKKIFHQESVPPELEEIGKRIARKCGGLPLSIVVIGGLLGNSYPTWDYWEYVAGNINTSVNSDDDEHCLKILSLSYSHLPIHLKPCFLYMGVFQEDEEISISRLIKLWVAEGFLKPKEDKTLEEVGKDYLEDLINRNIIMVSKLGCTKNMKKCKVHDLLRDLSMREAVKERFLYSSLTRDLNKDLTSHQRRIAVNHLSSEYTSNYPEVWHALRSASSLRSLICKFNFDLEPFFNKFKLLRVLTVTYFPDYCLSASLRYIHLNCYGPGRLQFPIHQCWNLQTLISSFVLILSEPCEIWKMQQLRHLMVRMSSLPGPGNLGPDEQDNHMLENLQTLSSVYDFICSEDVVRRIPNLKKLELEYHEIQQQDWSHYCLQNLCTLRKLENLYLSALRDGFSLLRDIEFPLSLKRLSLSRCEFDWDEIAAKIGPLPNLESLKMSSSVRNGDFHPIEGQFCRLRYLFIRNCYMKNWTADDTSFPNLEHLFLESVNGLDEIPLGIGDIATLELITLRRCRDSIIDSAKEVIAEQRSLGSQNLRLQVRKIAGLVDRVEWF